MGERGIKRPVFSPEGTTQVFEWPMGMSRGQRDYLARKAREVCTGQVGVGGCMIRWLQRNAWRHMAPGGGAIRKEA